MLLLLLLLMDQQQGPKAKHGHPTTHCAQGTGRGWIGQPVDPTKRHIQAAIENCDQEQEHVALRDSIGMIGGGDLVIAERRGWCGFCSKVAAMPS